VNKKIQIFINYTSLVTNLVHEYPIDPDRILRLTSQLKEELYPLDFSEFTEEELKILGFAYFDKDLLVAPKWVFPYMKEGQTLTSISGSKVVVGKDYIDDDTRFGRIAYGITKQELRDATIQNILTT